MALDLQLSDMIPGQIVVLPVFSAGQGSQCCPVGLDHHVGPSAILRKSPSRLKVTAGIAESTTTPTHMTTPYTGGAYKRISQSPPLVATWTSDCLRMGIPSQYITSHQD